MKFRLVDRITAWTPYQRISGIKTVSFEEYCLKEAFGDVLESFLQLGNWLIVLSSDFQQMGMVARVSEVRFHEYLRPGQTLHLEARLIRRREDGFELAGEGQVDGQCVISGLGCVACPAPLADYHDPENLRVLFSEIYEPPPGAPASLGALAFLPARSHKDARAGTDAGAPNL